MATDQPQGFSGGVSAINADQVRLARNAQCDMLMKEGIDGRHDDDAVARTCLLTTLAVELGRKDGIARAFAWHKALERKGTSGELSIILDFSRAHAIAGERYGTAWHWNQPTLAREIFYLRRAVSNPDFPQVSDVTKCKCLNNLGRRLSVAGRAVEALEYWRRTLEVCPNFGMALFNRARALYDYAASLENVDGRVLLMWMAHREASAAISPTAVYTDVRDEASWQSAKAIKERIESEIDVAGIAALDPLASHDTAAIEEERNYRAWCLVNYLFLNPFNDLGPFTVAASDSVELAGHVVRVDAPHKFESFFDQMKQEYVSARWLLYEGLTAKMAHFSDRDVSLGETEPRPALSLAIEQIKSAYKTSYSLFDKIGFFLGAYMGLGITEDQITFRTLWRADENKPIRREFELTGNWGFCALYWLAKDFLEKETDEVAEPQARGLSEIRNYIEHKYLRVTVAESPITPPDDLALMVSREEFQAKALHLLKLARSALIYLAIGVGLEERRREADRVGVPLEEIPVTPRLPDAEKV